MKQKAGSAHGIRPLSAVSKFVWTAAPEVGVIYDRLARTCLVYLGYRVTMGDYGAFVSAFRLELANHDGELVSALSLLDPAVASAPWIKSKLLDLWLYTNGKATGRGDRPAC